MRPCAIRELEMPVNKIGVRFIFWVLHREWVRFTMILGGCQRLGASFVSVVSNSVVFQRWNRIGWTVVYTYIQVPESTTQLPPGMVLIADEFISPFHWVLSLEEGLLTVWVLKFAVDLSGESRHLVGKSR